MTGRAFSVLFNPPPRPPRGARVTAVRNLRPNVCIKSKFHLTCHILFFHGWGRGDLKALTLLYIADAMFVCASWEDSVPWCGTVATFGDGCHSTITPKPPLWENGSFWSPLAGVNMVFYSFVCFDCSKCKRVWLRWSLEVKSRRHLVEALRKWRRQRDVEDEGFLCKSPVVLLAQSQH